MNHKMISLSLIMFAMLGLAAWTTFLSYPREAKIKVKKSILPDAFMEGVVATMMNKQGKLHMKITTDKLVHYSQEDKSILTTPHIMLYEQSAEPWHINAKHAEATQGIDNIFFWENVFIHHLQDLEHADTTIDTQTLLVHLQKKTAETRDLIKMTQPGLSIKAVGLHADLNTGDIKLLSKTHGEYLPHAQGQ